MFGRKETSGSDPSTDDKKNAPPQIESVDGDVITGRNALDQTGKTRWQRIWPAMAAGAGLFSDGYLQSAIGPVNTCLSEIYGDFYTKSNYYNNITSIAFAGTVLGQLVFGYTSDRYSRKWSLLVSTVILFVFAALGTGAYGANGSAGGLLAALTAYRFLLGIGIGGEYPAGSVACAESTGELKYGHRNRWFVLFTNVQLDIGFVAAPLMAMIIAAGAPGNYGLIWRLTLGLGLIPPLSLLYFRIKLKDPESYQRESFKAKTPYWLALKFYGPRLFVVCVIWFIYDFLTYPFSIFSSVWIQNISGNTYPLWVAFGWSTLINLFYVPGALIGAFTSDWMGPRLALSVFVAAQGIVGFIMSGTYQWLKEPKNVGGFVVVYGIFLALGEIGPGDNIGLIASKTSSTGIRGKYYAIAAACGKIGAFIGNYIFPYLEADGGSDTSVGYGQYPFFLASALCLFSACIVWFLPHIGQDTIEKEDARFRAYLLENGFDISQMGNVEWQDIRRESLVNQGLDNVVEERKH